jgi:hypothetical protein
MIYKLIVAAIVLATLLYYFFCFMEIFGILKFTDENTTVKMPQMFIPFYYLLHKDKPQKEVKKPRVKPINNGEKVFTYTRREKTTEIYKDNKDN